MAFQSLFRTTTALKIIPADTVITLATVPTVTSGRIRLYSAKQEELISFSGVSGSTITGCVRNLSLTANPATAGTGLTWVAGTSCELVIMHDQMIDPVVGGTYTGPIVYDGDVTFNNPVVFTESFKEPVYANAAARDAAIPSPTNGMSVYLTAEGYFSDYQGGTWGQRATGTSTVNASTTVAGKVEMATTPEIQSLASAGGTGAPLVITSAQVVGYYYKGDGSDGDVTISGNTSLARDMYYNNLTVNTGVTLDPAGYAIYVAGTLTLTGTAKIARNGNAGGAGGNGVIGGAAGAAGTAGTALATGTCGVSLGGTAGGAGGNAANGGNGTAGTAVAVSYATAATNSAAGGTGGNGTGWTGGTSGANATVAARGAFYNTFWSLGEIIKALSFQARGSAIPTSAYGGLPSSGSGGGGAGNNGDVGARGGGGGGSGGNGGNIMIFANILAGTGTIESKGGAGGAGGNGVGTVNFGGGGGGGGGGCGGIVVLVYNSGTPYTITVTGGALGAAGTSSGLAGTAGGVGTAGTSIVINK